MQAEIIALAIGGIVIGLLVLSYYFAKAVGITKPLKSRPTTPGSQAGYYAGIGGRISSFYSWAKKDPFSAAVLTLVIVVVVAIGYSYWQNNFPDEVYTFSSQEEFLKNWQVVSGNCYAQKSQLNCQGQWRIQSKRKFQWSKIEIVPADREITNLYVITGPIRYDYWQQEESTMSLYRATSKDTVYKGSVSYENTMLPPIDRRVYKTDISPRPLTFYKSSFSLGGTHGIEVDNIWLTSSNLDGRKDAGEETLSIGGDNGANIWRINIY